MPVDLSNIPDAPNSPREEVDLSNIPSRSIPEIRAGEPIERGLLDRLFSSSENRRARARSAVALSEELGVSPTFAYEHQEELTKQIGLRGVPTFGELAGELFKPAIGAGLISAPAKTVMGLLNFAAVSEISNAAVSLIKGEPYRVFQNEGLHSFLPEEASTLTKDVVETIDLIAKGFLASFGGKYASRLTERMTKHTIETHNLPRNLYIDPAALKRELQTGGVLPAEEMELVKALGLSGAQYRRAVNEGLFIRIPSEKIFTYRDRPWFAKVKQMLRLEPFEPIVRRVSEEPPVTGQTGRPTRQIEQQQQSSPSQETKPLPKNEAVEQIPARRDPVAVVEEPPVFEPPEGELEFIEQEFNIPEIESYNAQQRYATAEAWRRTQEILNREEGKFFTGNVRQARELAREDPGVALAEEIKAEGGFDRQQFEEQFPPEVAQELREKYGQGLFRREGGSSPSELASLSRFETADSLVNALRESPGRKEVTDRLRSSLDAESAKRFEEYILSEEAGIFAREEAKFFRKIKGKSRRPETTLTPEEERTVTESEALREVMKAAQRGSKEGFAAGIAKMKRLAAERKTREKAISDIKRVAKLRGPIAVEYQKRIKEITDGLDYTKLSDKKRAQLQGLQTFLEENGTPLDINPKYIKELGRLSKKPAADMTTEELLELRDTVKVLEKIGRLKQKLRYKYNRKRLEDIQAEIAETANNIDPRLPPDTRRGKAAAGLTQFYIETLRPVAVADWADGVREYGGPQARLKKMAAKAVQNANAATQNRTTRLLEFLQENGVNSLEPGSVDDVRLNVLMRLREDSRNAASRIMKKYGLKEVPEETPQEKAILDFVQNDMEAQKADLIAAWEETTDKVFPERPVYLSSLKYEGESEFGLEKGPSGGRTTHVYDGFAHKRQEGSKRTPRVGFIELVQETIAEQEWFKAVQPVVEDIKAVTQTDQFKQVAGEFMYNWWRDDLDILARRGWSATAQTGPVQSVLREARHNVSTGILAFKLSTIALQPFAVFDGMAYVNARWGPRAAAKVAEEVTKSFLVPGYTRGIVAGSPELQQRQGGELVISEELSKAVKTTIKDKLTRTGFGLIQETDLKTAAGVQEAVRKILKNEGLSDEEALAEAEFVMGLTQASTNVANRPHILSRGEAARTWFTFATFITNRWAILVHDLVVGKIKKGEFKQKIAGLVSIGILVAAGLTEDEARKQVRKWTTGKGSRDNRPAVERALTNLVSTAPVMGQIIDAASRGREATPAAVRTATQGAGGIYNIFFSEEADQRARGALSTAEAAMILYFGYPGSAQVFDFIEAKAIPDKRKKNAL